MEIISIVYVLVYVRPQDNQLMQFQEVHREQKILMERIAQLLKEDVQQINVAVERELINIDNNVQDMNENNKE